MRFDVIKGQHDQLEAEQKAKLAKQDDLKAITDPDKQKVEAKAELIRSTMKNKPVSSDVRQELGDDTTTGGDKFLPKTVSTEILSEPYVKNQLREISDFTQITNLEIPKIGFTLGNDDFIADGATARELAASGDVVTFGRHKFKVFAGISETVLMGSGGNLVSHVDRALSSGVDAKEKKVGFEPTRRLPSLMHFECIPFSRTWVLLQRIKKCFCLNQHYIVYRK